MVEYAPQTRDDEQYPLLKVSSGDGAGDGATRQQTPTVVPRWNVTCSSKRSWLSRWPEFVTACWMTGILLGISFLVMYVLTMGAIRKQSLVIFKCNDSKPGSEVYFHEIIPHESSASFMFYSDHLAHMALQYPFLQFNVFFLIDDSLQSNIRGCSRHTKLISKLMPYHYPRKCLSNFEKINAIELRDFQLKYENVNITIIPLSKYMAQTPLRYKWRILPIHYLTFYARIFSVWRTGGVGMDFALLYNKFKSHQYVDRRIASILQQHNEGIKPEEYMEALNIVQRDEEKEFLDTIYGLVNHMLNETRSFFNRTFTQLAYEKDFSSVEPLIRTHRNKRNIDEATKKYLQNSTDGTERNKLEFVNATTDNATNEFDQTSASVALINNTKSINITKNKIPINIDDRIIINDQKPNFNMTDKEANLRSNNSTDGTKFIVFYDFSLLSDGLGPPYIFSEPIQSYADQSLINSANAGVRKSNKGPPNILFIDSNGLFVSASSRLHPFLGSIISAGCQRISPKIAIHDTYLTQCGALFKDDVYCNNIFLL